MLIKLCSNSRCLFFVLTKFLTPLSLEFCSSQYSYNTYFHLMWTAFKKLLSKKQPIMSVKNKDNIMKMAYFVSIQSMFLRK